MGFATAQGLSGIAGFVGAHGAGWCFSPAQGGEGMWSPLSLGSSLAAWYKADAGCYTDAACLFASASSQYTSRASSAALQTGDVDFTFVFFVKPTDLLAYYGLLFKGDTNVAGGEYRSYIDQTSGTVTFQVRNAADAAVASAISTDTLTAGSWAMVELYHDKTNDVIGVKINNGTAVTAALAGGAFVGTSNFGIGSVFGGASSMNGSIGRVGFWKRLLTAGERTSLYNAGAGKFYADLTTAEKVSLVEYWNLCESSSTRVGSHAGLNLTPTNGPTVAAGPGEGLCVDNSPCKRQEDQSGLGFHKTQATIGKQPIWTANVHNGRPALVGDGSDDSMACSSDIFTSSYIRVAYVLATQPGSGGSRAFAFNNGIASVGSFGGAQDQWGFFGNEASAIVNIGGDLTRDIIGIEIASTTVANAYVNDGAAVAFDPNDTFDFAFVRGWCSHAQNAAGAAPGNASISEEILMLAVPTTGQRASIKSYMNTRYAAY